MTWLTGSEVESLAVLRVATKHQREGEVDLHRMKRGLSSQEARDLAEVIYNRMQPASGEQERMLAAVDVVAAGR